MVLGDEVEIGDRLGIGDRFGMRLPEFWHGGIGLGIIGL